MKYFIKSLSFFLLASPLVSAEFECEKFQNTLGNINNSTINCFTNEDGEINKLYIDNVDLTKEQVDQIFSYDLDDVTDLTYIVNVGSVDGEVPGQHLGYGEIPSSINKLSNLEYLTINYDSKLDGYTTVVNVTMEETFKDLDKLKSLTLRGINVSQHDINEISELDNLESLSFIYSYLGDGINYESLKNLDKLTTLKVINDPSHFYCFSPYSFVNRFCPNELVNACKSVKDLTIEIFIDNIDIDLPDLEKLSVTMDSAFTVHIPNKLEKLIEFDLTSLPSSSYDTQLKNIELDLSLLNDNLEKLSISRYYISENIQKQIANFSNLKELTLNNSFN